MSWEWEEEEEEERKVKPKEKGIRTPPTGAGLLRFYEEETAGIKIGPVAVILMATLFVTIVTLAWVLG